MSAGPGKLIVMAGQVADFFRPYPPDVAVRSIAEHLNKFWTRKMREDFLALPEMKNGTADPLLVDAARSIRTGQDVTRP